MSVEYPQEQLDQELQQDYSNSLRLERQDRSPFNITILNQQQFDQISPPLETLQSLSYGRYTLDQKPAPVNSSATSELSEIWKKSNRQTAFIVALGETTHLLQKPTNDYLKSIETPLGAYNIGGFFRVDWGFHVPGVNFPNEAMVLFNEYNWPEGEVIGYAGSFTPHPLLPPEVGLPMLDDMLARLYHLAARENFTEQIYAIFAPHVKKHVLASGAMAIRVPGDYFLNYDDPYARSVFETFPYYWNGDRKEGMDPLLYKLIPPELRQKWQ